jgi:acetylornithine deacetylase
MSKIVPDPTVDHPERGAIPAGVVGLAAALVATPSVNPALEAGGSGEAAVAALAAGWLRAWGFHVELVEAAAGRPSVVARLSRGPGRTLILNGHLDTVGVGGMSVAPFGAEVRDGRLWGRGAADMKGGVAAALAAARDAAAGAFRGTLIVALTADEEEAGLGCRRLVADGLKADAAIVCEPTSLNVMPAHKGFVWVQVDFRGHAAHGSRPDRGVDAIRHAGLFLAALDDLDLELSRRTRHPLLGRGSIHAGTIAGGTTPSVYPSSCRLVLERRTLPRESARAVQSEIEYLLARLRSDVSDLDAEVRVVLDRNGSELGTDHELVRSMTKAAREAGIEAEVRGMSAWVEAVVFHEGGTPAVCFGPGDIGEAHSDAESVRVEDLERAQRALGVFIRRFLW